MRIFIIGNLILFSMKDCDWEFELIKMSIEEFHGLNDGFGHTDTQKWDHKSVLKYGLNEFIIFGQSCWVNH